MRSATVAALLSVCCSGAPSLGPTVTTPSHPAFEAGPDGAAPADATAVMGALYFTDPERGGGVFRSATDGTEPRQIISFGDNAAAIATDNRYLYYSGYGAEGVWRANLDGTSREQIVASISPSWAIAVTATTLYFTDPATGGGVFRAGKDGKSPAQIISFGDNAGAIATDDRYLYYSGYGAEGVWRANLDGSNRQQIVTSIYPSWAIAVTATTLYFTDPERGGGVFRANKDGKNPAQIISFGDNAGAIATDDSYLYYSGYGAEGVWRAKLDGTDRQQIVRSMFPAWAICLSKT